MPRTIHVRELAPLSRIFVLWSLYVHSAAAFYMQICSRSVCAFAAACYMRVCSWNVYCFGLCISFWSIYLYICSRGVCVNQLRSREARGLVIEAINISEQNQQLSAHLLCYQCC